MMLMIFLFYSIYLHQNLLYLLSTISHKKTQREEGVILVREAMYKFFGVFGRYLKGLENIYKHNGLVWYIYKDLKRFENTRVKNRFCSWEFGRLFSCNSFVFPCNNFWKYSELKRFPFPYSRLVLSNSVNKFLEYSYFILLLFIMESENTSNLDLM